MKRNKQTEKHKEFLKLQKLSNENSKAQRNLGWVELEEPIPHGWTATWTLREDIQRRADADVFWEIIRLIGGKAWSRNKDFLKKTKKRTYELILPTIYDINEYTYENLRPAVKKHFTKVIDPRWYHPRYVCTVPRFYWEIEISRNYITHKQLIDEVLKQEEAEIDDQIYSAKYREFHRNYNHAPKSFVKPFNRAFRRKCKHITYMNAFHDKEIPYPITGKHQAAWIYW